MAAKKPICLCKLTFDELKDKAKEVEGVAGMNRFEMLMALKNAAGSKICSEVETVNPREIKPEISSLKKKLVDTPKADKTARKELRQAVADLKRKTRKYL